MLKGVYFQLLWWWCLFKVMVINTQTVVRWCQVSLCVCSVYMVLIWPSGTLWKHTLLVVNQLALYITQYIIVQWSYLEVRFLMWRCTFGIWIWKSFHQRKSYSPSPLFLKAPSSQFLTSCWFEICWKMSKEVVYDVI